MAQKKLVSKFSRVTREGRVAVDVDKLYRSKQVQKTLTELDDKINRSTQEHRTFAASDHR
jgi:hypothetical protein